VRPSGTALPDPPAVESNTSNDATTTVSASDGSATVTMPAGAWPSGGAAGDWVVLRVDPLAAPASGLPSGFDSVGHVLEVTAHWALSGAEIHQFNAPLEILFAGAPAKSLPLTNEGGWHVVPPLAGSGTTLPSSQPDGFFRDALGSHVATHHLTRFLVANDTESPSPPTGLRGTFGDDGMTLTWTAAKDNSGFLGAATVYANGQPLADAGSAGEAKLGRVDASDNRAFTVAQTDLVGNAGPPSRALRILPNLTGMTPAQARTALQQRGLRVGSVTVASAPGVQPGTIAQPTGLSAAEEGSAIDLVVAAAGPQAKLAFSVVAPTRVTARAGSHVPARISVSKSAAVSATLYDPRSRKLKTWQFSVKAGVTIKKLQLPASASRPGRYKLAWIARSGVESIRRTIVVQVVPKGAAPPKTTRAVEIVLVGASSLRDALSVSLHDTRARVTRVSDEDSPFTLAGSASRNVRVVVVDVDEHTLSLVHDLRTVFPRMAVVALAQEREKLAPAVAAGATVALPRSTPANQLAKVVRRLASF
jgi:hypothetical protein